jgi:hypothetical protein
MFPPHINSLARKRFVITLLFSAILLGSILLPALRNQAPNPEATSGEKPSDSVIATSNQLNQEAVRPSSSISAQPLLPDTTLRAMVSESFGKLSLSFEANEGQTNPQVKFLSRGSGYNLFWQFWLSKLNQFNGNFVQAEMVKAFLSADEYRKRFGQ